MTTQRLRAKLFFLERDIILSQYYPNMANKIMQEQSDLLLKCAEQLEVLERAGAYAH